MADPHARELLLVEGDEMSRDILSRRLASCGFEVLVTADGPEGLSRARAHPPALMLLELRVPRLDGWELARRLKADPATRGIPIIALSAHALAEDRAQAIAAGCEEYAPKPVDFRRLLGTIDRLLAAGGGC